MNENNTQDNLWIRAYTPAGFQVSITFMLVNGLVHASEVDRTLAEAGYLNQPPGIEDGENVETITTIVRREHVGKNGEVTPVIDLYPEWRGDYGKFRFCGIYLNTPEDVREFESQSGLKLNNIPLYESQAPIQRNPARATKHEIACKPFKAVKVADREKEVNGTVQMTYKFARYGSPTAAQQPPQQQQHAQPTPPAPQPDNGVPPSQGKLSERKSKPAGVLWFTDSSNVAIFQKAYGIAPGQAAAALKRDMMDFDSPQALGEAYRNHVNPQ